MEYDAFRSIYRHDVTLAIAPDLTVAGEAITALLARPNEVKGIAKLMGTARVNGEYVSLTYELTNTTVRGYGSMLLRVAPSGKVADRYALYRRTNPENGQFGLGVVKLTRIVE